jgi:16S rRNA A1518/A1519 N6-dimethyltransferase RsmA/KsgA/DIM1 with predicted DNA glycosylase/AP lyase activity
MTVIEILPKLKANRYTYYNLSEQDAEYFKKLYRYLLKHKNKTIRKNVFQNSDALKNSIKFWLNNKNELDYIRKIKVMQLISTNLIF